MAMGEALKVPPTRSRQTSFPLALVMLIALLQPSKGAVIALQWWNGMHGFKRERPEGENP